MAIAHHTNGKTMPRTVQRRPAVPEIVLAELDNWDSEIAVLDQALKDVATARELLADAQRRASVARERCRLLYAAITLLVQGTPPAV